MTEQEQKELADIVSDPLDTVGFFDLMQRYRYAPESQRHQIIQAYKDVEQFVHTLLKKRTINAIEAARREGFEEAIKLSDEIERASGDTTMPEWKAFKHFRNTLRDKYLKD